MTTKKAVAITVVLVALVFTAFFIHTPQTSVNTQVGKTFPNITITETFKPIPPRYPYSLVPAGVHSVAQLATEFKYNPAYAAQFPGFDFSKAHIVHIERLGYVSFLKNGKIGWTKKPQLLSEDVITDGKYFIRMQCGNGIAFTPQVPTIPSVTNEMLNTPLPPAEGPPAPPVMLPPEVSLSMPPLVTVETPTEGSTPTGGLPISGMGVTVYPGGGGGVPPRIPIAVPEPSEWALAFLALNAILFTQFFKKRRK
jgi:hypothetical protein